jgi:pyridoxamine 5'-phosphate oxidase
MDNASTDTILLRIWSQLEAAAHTRSPFNFMQLATVAMNGAPRLRTVVLRDFRSAEYIVGFTADARSQKIEEVRKDPRVAMVALDAGGRIQLRIEGRAEVVDDTSLRLNAWRKLKAHSHVLFRSGVVPGSGLHSPMDIEPGMLHELSSLDPGEHFALLFVHMERMDWLDVSGWPHQRCTFERTGLRWYGEWVAP